MKWFHGVEAVQLTLLRRTLASSPYLSVLAAFSKGIRE